jgi:hypothetical protein
VGSVDIIDLVNIPSALAALGVRADTLAQHEREQLDRNGHPPLPGILSRAQVVAFCARLAALTGEAGDRAGLDAHQEAGTDRLASIWRDAA